MTEFPASVRPQIASVSVDFTADDDLGEAQATYQARLALWRERNGKEGGMDAFYLLVEAAAKFDALERLVSA